MTLVIPAGYAAVIHSLVLSGDPQPYAITYGVETPVATPADAASLATDLHNAYHTNINPTNASVLTLTETTVRVQVAGAPVLLVGSNTTPHAGAGGSAALVPQNTALLVHKRTAYAGRTGRGRCYFPALNEANVDLVGQISGAWLATMNAAVAAWRTAIVASGFVTTMALLHDDTGAGATLPPYEVLSLSVDALCATQRRRLRR